MSHWMNKTAHLNLFCNKIAFNKTVWTIKYMIFTGVLFSYQISNCISRTKFGGYYGFGLVAPLPRPPQRFSCERSTGCSSSRIIFKFGMKVRYGKAKTPIVFGVGGVIVAMETTFFCGNILEPVTLLFLPDCHEIWHTGPI